MGVSGRQRRDGETPEGCVARECREELDVVLRVGDCLTAFDWSDPPMRFSFYRARIVAGEPVCRVHTQLAWVRPQALGEYPLCPADVHALDRMHLDAKEE